VRRFLFNPRRWKMSKEGDSTILAFLLGGVIGAGVTLLLAPWSGKEARDKLKGAAEEAREKAETVFSQTKDALEKGKEVLEKERFNIKSAFEAGKEAYRGKKGKGEAETGKEEESAEAAIPT
jgi:gas vesicle protein